MQNYQNKYYQNTSTAKPFTVIKESERFVLVVDEDESPHVDINRNYLLVYKPYGKIEIATNSIISALQYFDMAEAAYADYSEVKEEEEFAESPESKLILQ